MFVEREVEPKKMPPPSASSTDRRVRPRLRLELRRGLAGALSKRTLVWRSSRELSHSPPRDSTSSREDPLKARSDLERPPPDEDADHAIPENRDQPRAIGEPLTGACSPFVTRRPHLPIIQRAIADSAYRAVVGLRIS